MFQGNNAPVVHLLIDVTCQTFLNFINQLIIFVDFCRRLLPLQQANAMVNFSTTLDSITLYPVTAAPQGAITVSWLDSFSNDLHFYATVQIDENLLEVLHKRFGSGGARDYHVRTSCAYLMTQHTFHVNYVPIVENTALHYYQSAVAFDKQTKAAGLRACNAAVPRY